MFEQDRSESPGFIAGYRIERWLSEAELRSSPYFDYWNNEEIEKEKAWYVIDRGFSDLNRHLNKTGLVRQLESCLDTAAELNRPVCGTGADLACGVFWTAPILLKSECVEKLYGVEYSRHRLFKIGPRVLDHYRVPPDKVVLCLGSFYRLALPDASLDFVILAEAFHHAHDPEALLTEIRRALKPGGVVLILGEHIMPHQLLLYGTNTAKYVASHVIPESVQQRLLGRKIPSVSLFPPLRELLKPDPILGDHFYLVSQYAKMFSSHGFEHRRVTAAGCPFQAFVLYGP